MFDQMIMNKYKIGESLTAHVDLLHFADGIASVSLAAPAVMTFTRITADCVDQCQAQASSVARTAHGAAADGNKSMQTVCTPGGEAAHYDSAQLGCSHDVLLEPGDLLLMHSEARFCWKHGIPPKDAGQLQDDQAAGRVSLTFRRMVVTQ